MIVLSTVNNWKRAVHEVSLLFTQKTCLARFKRDGLQQAYRCMLKKKPQPSSCLRAAVSNRLADMKSLNM